MSIVDKLSKDDLVTLKSGLETGQKMINEGNAVANFAKTLIVQKYGLADGDNLDLDTGVITRKSPLKLATELGD